MKGKELLNDRNKKLNWLNRNYFFAVTITIVLINIIIYAVFKSRTDIELPNLPQNAFAVIRRLLQAFVNTYTHANWQHALLNMLCFLIAGIYLERKMGSLHFFLFMIILSLFTAFATCVNWSLHWYGFSGANYGLYGYILIGYIFELCQKKERYAFNIICGAIIVALIYFAMCFNGGTAQVSFVWYPYDLLHNTGHVSGFLVGLSFGLYEQISALIRRRSLQ